MPRTLSALRKGPRLAAWGPSGHRCGLASHSTPGASWLFPSPGVPGILEAVPWALGAGSSPDRGRQAQLLPAGTRGQGASPGKGTGKCRRPCRGAAAGSACPARTTCPGRSEASEHLFAAGHSWLCWHWALACMVPTFSLLLSSEGRSEGLVGWCVRLRPLGDEQSWESLPGRAAAQAQHGGAGPLHRGAPWFPSNANRAALLLQGSVASGVREARKDLTGGGSTRGHGQLPKCGGMVGTWTRILPLFQAVNTSGAALFGDHRLPHGAPHTVPGSSRLMVASGCGLAERVAL